VAVDKNSAVTRTHRLTPPTFLRTPLAAFLLGLVHRGILLLVCFAPVNLLANVGIPKALLINYKTACSTAWLLRLRLRMAGLHALPSTM
jgi:hypothetical protein